MKPNELIAKVKSAHPALLNKVDEKVAAQIVRYTLAELGKQLTEAEEGAVRVPGLGSFKIKQVEKEKDGEKQNARRISFRVAKPANEEQKAKRKAKKAETQEAGKGKEAAKKPEAAKK